MKRRASLIIAAAVLGVGCSRDSEPAAPEQTAAAETAEARGDSAQQAEPLPRYSFDPALRPAAIENMIEDGADDGADAENAASSAVVVKTEKKAAEDRPGSSAEKAELGNAGREGEATEWKPGPNTPGIEGREAGIASQIVAMPDGDARNLAFAELMRRWVEEDPQSAMGYRDEVEDSIPLKRAFNRGVMPHFARTDPEFVLDTIESGEWWQDQWRESKQAVLRVARYDLDRATGFFSNASPGKQQNDVAYQLANRVAVEQGAEAALAFADTLKKPLARAYAVRAAVSDWVYSDSYAASQYVNELTDPQAKNHAILGLIDGIWLTNPDDSVTWAQDINSADLRTRTLVSLAQAWQQRGQPGNIEAMLGNSGLSAADADAVRAAIESESE